MTSNGTTSIAQSPASLASDIRDAKPPVEIPNVWLWVWTSLALVLLAAVAVAAFLRWRKHRALPPAVPVTPPHMRARHRLAEALRLIQDPNAFCTAVSAALRDYLEERFDFHAPERTTEEFLIELKATQRLNSGQKTSLGLFLESCDLVKFARFEPPESTLRELHESALRLVDETRYDPLAAAAPSVAPPPLPCPPAPQTVTGPPA